LNLGCICIVTPKRQHILHWIINNLYKNGCQCDVLHCSYKCLLYLTFSYTENLLQWLVEYNAQNDMYAIEWECVKSVCELVYKPEARVE